MRAHRPTVSPLPASVGPLASLAPGGAAGVWFFLREDGVIGRWRCGDDHWQKLARTPLDVPPGSEPWTDRTPARRLHVSADGRFAAVVIDYKRYGRVLDLSTGAVTMRLDGGDDDCETVPFSLAFTEHQGRTLLVHRTDWNRLDVSDPADGTLLTGRSQPPYTSDRYLDYFHGALHLSPDGRRIADDGWIWQPVGAPLVWSLHRWLTEDPYEADAGATLFVADYADRWDVPMVWLDDDRLAIGSTELLGDEPRPGARVVHADGFTGSLPWRTATDFSFFPGPEGRFFAADGLLYAAASEGLTTWDPGTGARLATVPGFRPTHHHRPAGELAALVDGALHRWTIA
ncbi:hypothetical protein [Kitasatospora sp. NPDC004289]